MEMSQRFLTNALSCAIAAASISAPTAIPAADHSGPSSDISTPRYLDGSDGSDWPGYGRTFGEQHYSPLAQIDRANVRRLGLAWSLDLGPENSVTQPIAVGGVLYFATGYSVVHAVDASSGKLLWRYDPKAAEKAGLNLRQGWGSRGIAWWNGKIYTGTQDGRLIAIDAKTGVPVWSVQTFDKDTAAYISGAPRVFDGKVIIGFASDSGKNRGYVTTYDSETGRQLWRFFTVPGDPADGYENPSMQMAAKTWAGKWWKYGGGGTVWNAMAYDVETGSVYIGTGGGYPMNRRVRSNDEGDNLFLASIVALDARTGAYKWHYQLNPGDTWDYDATMDIELADLTIAGHPRKVLMQAPKNGFYYVIDRINGQLISAQPIVKVTWASRIDMETGRPVENPGVRYPNGSTTSLIWPGGGAHSWMPMAYSPKTRLTYIPVLDAGSTFSDKGIDLTHWQAPTDRSVEGDKGYEAAVRGVGDSDGGPKVEAALLAWNPRTQKSAWKVRLDTIANGGVVATGGDLIFQGTVDGVFKAYSALTGERLWSFPAQAPLLAAPISYAVNGLQYVTVLTGLGTGNGIMAVWFEKYGVDPRSQARRVLTFSLDGKAQLPPANHTMPPAVEDPNYRADDRTAAVGEDLYVQHCATCHGYSVVSGTHAPDLRRSAIPLSTDAFDGVVRKGGFVSNGMPAFAEFTNVQLYELRQYIRMEAAKLRSSLNAKDVQHRNVP